MEPLAALWERAIRPVEGFRARAREAPALRFSLQEMLLLRSPIAFLELVLGFVGFRSLYGRLCDPHSPLWTDILQHFPEQVDPRDLREALARLPDLPPLAHALPWMLLLAPLVVLSLWLHDVGFDHLGLWMLRGLRGRRSLGLTCVAEAEALKVGVLGAVLALLGNLPGPGISLLLVPVAVYFWILRGFALAAWHGCPPWKGVLATLLNAVLAGAMLLILLLACLIMVLVVAGGS